MFTFPGALLQKDRSWGVRNFLCAPFNLETQALQERLSFKRIGEIMDGPGTDLDKLEQICAIKQGLKTVATKNHLVIGILRILYASHQFIPSKEIIEARAQVLDYFHAIFAKNQPTIKICCFLQVQLKDGENSSEEWVASLQKKMQQRVAELDAKTSTTAGGDLVPEETEERANCGSVLELLKLFTLLQQECQKVKPRKGITTLVAVFNKFLQTVKDAKQEADIEKACEQMKLAIIFYTQRWFLPALTTHKHYPHRVRYSVSKGEFCVRQHGDVNPHTAWFLQVISELNRECGFEGNFDLKWLNGVTIKRGYVIPADVRHVLQAEYLQPLLQELRQLNADYALKHSNNIVKVVVALPQLQGESQSQTELVEHITRGEDAIYFLKEDDDVLFLKLALASTNWALQAVANAFKKFYAERSADNNDYAKAVRVSAGLQRRHKVSVEQQNAVTILFYVAAQLNSDFKLDEAKLLESKKLVKLVDKYTSKKSVKDFSGLATAIQEVLQELPTIKLTVYHNPLFAASEGSPKPAGRQRAETKEKVVLPEWILTSGAGASNQSVKGGSPGTPRRRDEAKKGSRVPPRSISSRGMRYNPDVIM